MLQEIILKKRWFKLNLFKGISPHVVGPKFFNSLNSSTKKLSQISANQKSLNIKLIHNFQRILYATKL